MKYFLRQLKCNSVRDEKQHMVSAVCGILYRNGTGKTWKGKKRVKNVYRYRSILIKYQVVF